MTCCLALAENYDASVRSSPLLQQDDAHNCAAARFTRGRRTWAQTIGKIGPSNVPLTNGYAQIYHYRCSPCPLPACANVPDNSKSLHRWVRFVAVRPSSAWVIGVSEWRCGVVPSAPFAVTMSASLALKLLNRQGEAR